MFENILNSDFQHPHNRRISKPALAQTHRATLAPCSCRPSRQNATTYIGEIALKASSSVCTTFRALQKRRQVAQPWLVVLTQFQSGVTILYIIWALAIHIPAETDLAIRDCTSVLAILADRWQNAEVYRDCFEVLAMAIPRCSRLGCLEREAKLELRDLIGRVSNMGLHRHAGTILKEVTEERG